MRELGIAIATLVAACSAQHKPEADPERLIPLMRTMDQSTLPPGVQKCKPEDMVGGATMTHATLLKIAKAPPSQDQGPQDEDWINPPELDVPAARELIDPTASELTRRHAAYELLSAPFFLVYRVEMVDAPMAIGVKDLKRGTVGVRVLRFDQLGNLECVKALLFQNTLAKSDWAIVRSNVAKIDPKIAASLRDDLRDQLLKRIPALGRQE
jgi:hypothetical protein